MHLFLLDRWNHLDSAVHRLDPRAKFAAVLALVLFLALSSRGLAIKLPAVAALVLTLIVASGVPLVYCLKRGCLVLPFAILAAAALWLSPPQQTAQGGQHIARSAIAAMIGKSYVSALAVLLLASTTRLSDMLKGLEMLRVPGAFLMIVHFIYRYLFVLSEEAQHMRYARTSRSAGRRRLGSVRAAASAIAVLFARSYARAERIHWAMLARGFSGLLPVERRFALTTGDAVFAAVIAGFLVLVQVASSRLV